MRSHRSRCVIFSASFSTLISLAAASAHAQLTPSAPLNQNIQPPSAQLGVGPAYYQTPNNGQLPPFPSPSAVSQVAFNQFSNPGGPMPATNVQQNVQSRLRDSNSGDNSLRPNVGYGGQGTYHNAAMQQPTFPPGGGNFPPPAQFPNQMQDQMQPAHLRDTTAAGSPQSPQTGYQQPGYQQPGYQQPNYQLQPAYQPGYQQQPINQRPSYQQTVVSGDPRFVSPPVGNYPTVPIRSPYRTVAYQLPQQAPMVQPVQPPNVLANQSAVLPNATSLPQYQPTVGQLASYQALQPGYNCAPGIPANGVPSFVPGAVAPPTLPPNMTPQLYSPDNSGYRPLFSLGQENYNVQLGRGIIGQPTVYVSGQPIRNFLRYLSP